MSSSSTEINNTASAIKHLNRCCTACASYPECKALDLRYAEELSRNGGNWRVLKDSEHRVPSPIRRCSAAALQLHVDKIKNTELLEIGCGGGSEINLQFCKDNQVRYVGIDPERLPAYFIPGTPGKSLQNRIIMKFFKLLGMRNLPRRNAWQRYLCDYFPSSALKENSFDCLYGNSTIEHWHENNEDIERSTENYKNDIEICRRLLRPGGVMLMNCPIHVHGNIIFKTGRIDLIESFFGNEWSGVSIEHYREDFGDLLPYCPENRKKSFKEQYNLDLTNLYLLNIVAVR